MATETKYTQLRQAIHLERIGELVGALRVYVNLVDRCPNDLELLYHAAYFFGRINDISMTMVLLDRIESLDGDVTFGLSQAIFCKMHSCDWAGLQHIQSRLYQSLALKPVTKVDVFSVLASTDIPEIHANMAACIASEVRSRTTNSMHQTPDWLAKRKSKARLRIGYVGGNLNRHAMSLALSGVIESHDRDLFQIFAYDHSAEDGSAARRRIKLAFDVFVSIENMSDMQAADRIRQDEIDLLVDLDGYTRNGRSCILAARPSNIQINFLGYPSSQSGEWIDYIIIDNQILASNELTWWTETPIRLPGLYFPNDRNRPYNFHPEVEGRVIHGLPRSGVVLACFNSPYKITPIIFAVWIDILLNLPDSVLWLYADNPEVESNLLQQAETLGISRRRLIFAQPVSLTDHIARHTYADLFLDTFPYGAHTTAVDALWAGLPVITLKGLGFASRVGASFLTAIGIPELICSTMGDYKKLVIDLATDDQRRENLKERLLSIRDTSYVYDAVRFTRDLEQAYLLMAAEKR